MTLAHIRASLIERTERPSSRKNAGPYEQHGLTYIYTVHVYIYKHFSTIETKIHQNPHIYTIHGNFTKFDSLVQINTRVTVGYLDSLRREMGLMYIGVAGQVRARDDVLADFQRLRLVASFTQQVSQQLPLLAVQTTPDCLVPRFLRSVEIGHVSIG